MMDDTDRPEPRKMKKDELIALAEKLIAEREEEPQSVIYCDKPLRSAEHPTMKPVRLIGELVRNSSQDGWAVLDLFGGSGTTLMACEALNRKAYMMEYDPKFVDVIIDRWQKATGREARLLKRRKTA